MSHDDYRRFEQRTHDPESGREHADALIKSFEALEGRVDLETEIEVIEAVQEWLAEHVTSVRIDLMHRCEKCGQVPHDGEGDSEWCGCPCCQCGKSEEECTCGS